jgi:hypothetical protein
VRLRTMSVGVVLLTAAIGTATASAQEAAPANARLAEYAQTRRAVAAAPAPSAHTLGLGVRVGGSNAGAGVSFRDFFSGPLGFQMEVLWSSSPGFLTGSDFTTVQFSPSVIYRLKEYKLDAPLTLQPYVGGGLSIIRSSFPTFFIGADGLPVTSDSDTSVGALLYGGVEFFFPKVPRLGVSAEITYASNSDVFGFAIGGPAFTAAAHWYFR